MSRRVIASAIAALGLSTPAWAFPHTGLYYQPNSRLVLSLYDGALEGGALLGGTLQPYQLLDLAARLPFPLANAPFGLPLEIHGLAGYRQQSSDRGDTLRGLDLAVQGHYRLYDWLSFHASLGSAVMVHGSLAGATTGLMPQPLPRFDLGASADLGAGVRVIGGLTLWTTPQAMISGGAFTPDLAWQPGLILGLNWAGPKLE